MPLVCFGCQLGRYGVLSKGCVGWVQYWDWWGSIVSTATDVCNLGITDAHKPIIEVYVILGLCAISLYCDVRA